MTSPRSPRSSTIDVLHLHADDNVVIATRDLEPDAKIEVARHSFTLSGRVGIGHKIALARIARGEHVIRYGQMIGVATQPIETGDWVHSHNLAAGELTPQCEMATAIPADPMAIQGRTFHGYRRADGSAGTRNYLAVISTVNCSASVGKYVAQRFDRILLAKYPNVDGILPLVHQGGCAMQFGGDDHQQLARVLAGFARHSNVGGYLLIGLGCETGSLPYLVERGGLTQIGERGRTLPPILTIQDCGGTSKTVEAAISQVAKMMPALNDCRRVPIPASEITVGLQCGGSDGNSGVTANPALGVASDMLVAVGGTVILSETPEIHGAEHLLTRRARTPEIAEKLLERVRWWEQYAGAFGVKLDNNPTPGNKQGGLTTIYEKSLGAVAKAGSTALCEVYRYAEPVTTKGFVFMDSPGYDPASATGQVASGANMICFTTGRGSCYGCKPVPSIKIASNTPMYERMIDDMDFDAGRVLAGATVAELGRELFEMILEVASGRKTKSEQHGIGEEEFVPWSIGPML